MKWVNKHIVLIPCLLFFFCLILNPAVGSSQENDFSSGPQFITEQWTTNNGLPINHINQVYQTPDGFIWLATFNGLIRFDGMSFREFNAGNTPSLTSNRIIAIQPGLGNSFWINTEQGHLLLVENGQFISFENQLEADGEIITSNNRNLVTTDGTRTWIGTRNGLFLYQNREMEVFRADIFRDRNITAIHSGKDHIVRVFDFEGFIWEIDANLDVIRKTKTSLNPGANVVAKDREGAYWLGRNEIAKMDESVYQSIHFPENYIQGWDRLHPYFMSIQAVPDGSLLIMSLNGLMKAKNDTIKAVDVIENKTYGSFAEMLGNIFTTCPDSSVWAIVEDRLYRNGTFVFRTEAEGRTIYCDREQNLWIATIRDGLFRYRMSLFDTITLSHSDNNFYGVFIDSYNTLWAGGFFSDLTQIDSEGVVREVIARKNEGTTATFLEASDGSLWNGYNRCRAVYRKEDGACLNFEPITEMSGKNVFTVFEDSYQRIWFGTNMGLFRLEDGYVEEVQVSRPGEYSTVRYMLQSDESTLWMATNGGGILKYRNGEMKVYTMEHGLTSNNIRSLLADEFGHLWIATEDMGLNRLNPKTGDIAVIRKQDGLFEDGLHKMITDDFGRLWISTNHGIFWVSFKQLHQFADGERNRVFSTFYNERDGMLNREANGGFQNTGFSAGDGRIYFTTQNGVVIIDPDRIATHSPLPQVILEDLVAGSEVFSPSLTATNLGNDQRSFTIQYTSPYFTAPDRVRYSYKLEGFDQDWIDAGSRRQAIYTNIPAGSYLFRVKADLGDEYTSSAETIHAIVISPYFYETSWFPFLIVLLIGLIITGGHLLRLKNLIRKEKILEKIVERRTNDLRSEKIKTEKQAEQLRLLSQEKNRFFANISHEFRTPLSLITGQIETLLVDETSRYKKQKLYSVNRNAERLLDLINQLLDLSKLEDGKMRLKPAQHNLVSFLKNLFFSFESLAESKKIQLNFFSSRVSYFMDFDAEKMERVFLNLFSNALKFTESGGHIDVSIHNPEPGFVEVRIKDSGIGISAELLPHIFDRFYQANMSDTRKFEGTGIGLALANELVKLHNGSISVTSQAGTGTEFVVKLPYEEKPVITLNETDLSDTVVPEPPSGHQMPDLENLISQNGEIILVVEDNNDVRQFIREQLKQEYTILEAENGMDGLEKAQNTIPDLIITDLMMPEMDGFRFSEKIRGDEKTSHIPIIMLTAKAGLDPKIEGLEAGIDAWLTKPFHVRELLIRVKTLIQQRKNLKKQFSTATYFKPSAFAENPVDQTFLRNAIEVIDKNLIVEEFNVDQFASSLNMSVSQLNRKLNALVDQPAGTFIRSVRLQRAVELLNQTDKTIAEICYEVGFNDQAYFSRAFKKQFGKSPSAFRKLTI